MRIALDAFGVHEAHHPRVRRGPGCPALLERDAVHAEPRRRRLHRGERGDRRARDRRTGRHHRRARDLSAERREHRARDEKPLHDLVPCHVARDAVHEQHAHGDAVEPLKRGRLDHRPAAAGDPLRVRDRARHFGHRDGGLDAEAGDDRRDRGACDRIDLDQHGCVEVAHAEREDPALVEELDALGVGATGGQVRGGLRLREVRGRVVEPLDRLLRGGALVGRHRGGRKVQ